MFTVALCEFRIQSSLFPMVGFCSSALCVRHATFWQRVGHCLSSNIHSSQIVVGDFPPFHGSWHPVLALLVSCSWSFFITAVTSAGCDVHKHSARVTSVGICKYWVLQVPIRTIEWNIHRCTTGSGLDSSIHSRIISLYWYSSSVRWLTVRHR